MRSSKFSLVQFREVALVAGPAILLVLAAFWVTSRFVAPAPSKEVVIAAASKGSPYYEAAERYRQILADNGITLTIRETSGSLENLALIKDEASGVDAAFLQGGVSSSRFAPGVESIGRVFHEPVWIFHNGPAGLERLTELAGKRVLIGPAGSATEALATRLLAASGVTTESARLINMALPDYVEALQSGAADAGLAVLGPEARTVRRLLAAPEVRLMRLSQADAYVQRFPFLTRIELKRGVVDFAADIPPADTRMLTTTAAVVVREELHPALVNLLTQALLEVHGQPRLNANGETGLFQRAGMFPVADDQEYPLSPDAARVYKSGPPFLQRYLPFWLATSIDRLTVLLLPMLGILLPVGKLAPVLYAWRVRRRIVYWYRELMRVDAEVELEEPLTAERLAELRREVDRIESAVNRLPVPLSFANQLYDLREHVNVVHRRLATLGSTVGAATVG
jgi:TRAP-type uncharacterized transport system substrate-binding protein